MWKSIPTKWFAGNVDNELCSPMPCSSVPQFSLFGYEGAICIIPDFEFIGGAKRAYFSSRSGRGKSATYEFCVHWIVGS